MALKNTLDPVRAGTQLEAWLQPKLTGGADSVTVTDVVTPHGTGLSAQTLLFEARWRAGGSDHAERLAARILPNTPEAQFYPAYDLDREFRVLEALHGAGLPVPAVRWAEHDADVVGGPFLVAEQVAGRVAGDDPPYTVDGWVLELSADEQAALFDAALHALVEVHTVECDATGLTPLLTGPHGLERELDYYQDFYTGLGMERPIPVIEATFEWVHAHRPARESEVALHWGDARLGNIMFADDLSVVAVLDFEGAALGQPEIDFGWWLYVQRMFTQGIGASPPTGFPSPEQQVARYEELAGRTLLDIGFYEILAALKHAIMLARAAQMMIAGELLAPDSEMAFNNPTTNLLASMLDLPKPSGESANYVGKR